MIKLVDSHAHVVSEKMIDDLEGVTQRAKDAGLEKVLIIATDIAQARIAIEVAEKDPFYDVAVGFHPTDLLDVSEQDWIDLEELLTHPRVVALGEIGMDYYWDNVDKETQEIGFRRQIELAQKYDLPISIHMRDATQDTVNILKDYAPISGVMHSYSGSTEIMDVVIKLGLYVSLGGPVTFKNGRYAPEIARTAPIDRILTETDSPYLTPHPFRGKPNEPHYVSYVFDKIAEIREIDKEELSKQILENYKTLFPKSR